MASLAGDLRDACEKGSLETVQDLIEGGLSANVETEDGWTPLIMASKEGHIEVTTHNANTHLTVFF